MLTSSPGCETADASVADERLGDTAGADGFAGSSDGATAPDSLDDEGPCAAPLGLCADGACETLQEGVLAFTPQYPLWSDGVANARCVSLPPGETIDVSDPDVWVFRVGTKPWKHFPTVDGTRLETRVIEKVADLRGEDGREFETYAWEARRKYGRGHPQGDSEVDPGSATQGVPNVCRRGRRTRRRPGRVVQRFPSSL